MSLTVKDGVKAERELDNANGNGIVGVIILRK